MPKNPHADFSPALEGYSGQGKFRFWCQMALPLTYDDSLSYYELLCKVVNYLNNTIEDVADVETNVSRLSDAYTQLQNYVNDYFDDLDVEAELRNVLDAMAEDGSLDDLLDPLVQDHLPSVVDDQIDDVVADQIGDAVAGQIDNVVAEQLPPLVEEGIPDEVSDWLTENVNPVGSAVVVDSSLTISGAAADAKVTGDKLAELKTQLSDVVDTLLYIPTVFTVNNYYYAIMTDALEVGRAYKIAVSVATAGSYTVQIGTEANLGSMVATLFDNVAFSANEVKYITFVPQNSGLRYIRLDSNSVSWSVSIGELFKADELTEVEEDVSELSENVNATAEMTQTSQMFNKNETPGDLYVKSDNEIVNSSTLSRSWIIPVEPSTRYVLYLTGTLANADAVFISLTSVLPAPGVYVTRKNVVSRHSTGAVAVETGETETYILLTMSCEDWSDVSSNANKVGLEQLDSGFDYKNEPYGLKSKLKAEVTTDNIGRETATEIIAESNFNSWYGKKIWWCGTSIPYGKDTALDSEGYGLTYPEMVGKLLGATVYNEAEGSSMARRSTRTGDYADGLSYNILLSLTQTAEEKEDIITNWSTIRQTLHDPNTMETLDSTWQTYTRKATFEERLMPYLDGTKEMPDLFVFDHGHNDWKSYYTMPDGTTPDTELEPTVANITNNILAEDSYMTANNNAKLISFFGEIANIPQNKRDAFIASVNRNCFIGAINFLCTLILSKNPRARIVFIGNLDNWDKPQVQPAQMDIANSWEFPIIKMWEYLGFSNHYIPNTATYWDSEGTTDLTVKQVYCKDNIHPHSDTTGNALEIYSKIIANALKELC